MLGFVKNLLAFENLGLLQAMAFGPVLEGQSCIIADQSGSGKTLAYLMPVIQHLREEELQGFSKSSSGSPQAVVIVPTAELASQVCLCFVVPNESIQSSCLMVFVLISILMSSSVIFSAHCFL